MASNFRITGNYYVSKGGHDSNDGLTPNSPKKSIWVTPEPIVVGSGYYNYTPPASGTRIIGDGLVKIKTISSFYYASCSDITFEDSNVVIAQNNTINRVNITGGSQFSVRGCFVNYSKIVNLSTTGSDFLNSRFDSCIFVNVFALSQSYITLIRDSFIDFNSKLRYIENPSIFRNNNMQGVLQFPDGNFYAIQDQFIGTPQDNGYAADVYWLNEANLTTNGYTGTIAGWDAAVATCINRDPKFNNLPKLDFTLQADSPHIGRASDGFSNIGGTEYAQSFYAGISNPNILLFETSEAIDTATNNNDWRLKSGYTEGWIRAIIKVSNNNVQISSIPYIGNYSFDSDQLGGSWTNMNVPDSKPITNEYPDYLIVTTQAANNTTLIIAGHGAVVGDWLWVDGQYREITGVPDADTVTFSTSLRAIVSVGTAVKIGTFESLASLNPNRLNMKMRSSKLVDVNASNWDNPLTWDNDGLSPSGQYMAQEWNNAPMIDSLNEVGFGDDNYDANYGNPINLKVVDIMIYLRNNYRS